MEAGAEVVLGDFKGVAVEDDLCCPAVVWTGSGVLCGGTVCSIEKGVLTSSDEFC